MTSYHQLGFRTVVIEFRFTGDVVDPRTHALRFRQRQENSSFVTSDFVLRCDDPIELCFSGIMPVQIGGGVQILSLTQKPRGGILQQDLPIERI